jgi:hypothetical protein
MVDLNSNSNALLNGNSKHNVPLNTNKEYKIPNGYLLHERAGIKKYSFKMIAISKTIWEGKIGEAIELINSLFPNFTKENNLLRKTLYIQ